MENDLKDEIRSTAFAFRGYNLTNLGRSDELLAHSVYGPVVKRHLVEASKIASDTLGKRVRLVDRVRHRRETKLKTYGEAIALIIAMELSQISLLEQFHGIVYHDAKLAFGYSLGELGALACSDALDMAQALEAPLAMSRDCAELAMGVTMGVLFSRGPALNLDDVTQLCLNINVEGKGVIGVSSILSPNTVLLLGQQDTVKRFKAVMHDLLPRPVHLRPNPHHWPPLHTAIMWQRNIPNRAAVMMHTMQGGFADVVPPVFSLVTGKASYNNLNARDILHQWIDHPQRLWDAIYETLSSGVETVVHVGPEPNLIPATFKRLSDNVTEQVSGRSLGSLGLRAVSGLASRQWLKSMLPSRTALLRAPKIRQIVLEDWLLSHPVSK